MYLDTEKTIGYQNSSEIFTLIASFENGTLPRESWTQTAYMTVVFWYLYMNPLPEACRLIRDGVRRYNFENNIVTNLKSHEILASVSVRRVSDYLKQPNYAESFVSLTNGMLRAVMTGEKRREIKTNFEISKNLKGGIYV